MLLLRTSISSSSGWLRTYVVFRYTASYFLYSSVSKFSALPIKENLKTVYSLLLPLMLVCYIS